MAWTSTDLTAIEKAISSGVLEVQYTDKKVKYASLSDLLKIRNLIRNDLGLNSPANNKRVAITSKGL